MDGNSPKNVLQRHRTTNPSVKALSGTDTGCSLRSTGSENWRLDGGIGTGAPQRGIDDLGEQESAVDSRYRLRAFLGLTKTWTVFSGEFGVMPMTNSSRYPPAAAVAEIW